MPRLHEQQVESMSYRKSNIDHRIVGAAMWGWSLSPGSRDKPIKCSFWGILKASLHTAQDMVSLLNLGDCGIMVLRRLAALQENKGHQALTGTIYVDY